MAITNSKNLYGVILAGGLGARLWPISRQLYPKQFLKLFGKKTLLQQTFSRLKKITNAGKIYVVTGKHLQENVYLQLKDLGCDRQNILIEPELKSTAPAIALAARVIHDKNSEATMVVCPADHFIAPDAKFKKVILSAQKAAQHDFLVTLGIKPSYPDPYYGYITDYGYVKPVSNPAKRKIHGISGRKAESFIEKPSQREVKKFIKKGYLWNSGIFIFKAKTLLKGVQKYLPEIYKTISINLKSPEFLKSYSLLQFISIDYGLMEKAQNIWVITGNFNWYDIGTWKALHRFLKKDKGGNVLIGDNIFYFDCENNLFYSSPKRIIGALGLRDLVVVDTEDAILVSHKNKSSEIKKLFEKLKENNLSQHLEHPTVSRPWGKYTVLEKGGDFKVKKVVVLPKGKLSLQAHQKRSEHWVVLQGRARAEINGKIYDLGPHQSVSVPEKTKHRLENPGNGILEIIEIQNGEYLGEDDIVRFDDKYDRLG